LKNLDEIKDTKWKIFHWNVNGLNAIIKKEPFIKHFEENNDYTIINLSETKLTFEKLMKMEFHKSKFWHE